MDQNSRAYIIQKAREVAAQYGIPPDLFISLIEQESQFNPNAVSPKGAVGVTQLMPGTAKDMGVDTSTLMGQLVGGAKYLNYTMGLHPGNINLALAAYNAGPGNVEKYGGIPPFEETQNYVREILGRLPGGKPANMPLSAKMTDRPVPPKEENMKFMDYLGNPQALKDRMMQRNPATGLTPMQNIASNMDAVVLRGYGIGDQIRQKGAQEAAYEEKQGQRNATIDMLRKRAEMGDNLARDILQAVESKSMTAAQGVALYYKERLAKPDASFTQKSGKQLNAELKAQGLEPAYDESKVYNVNTATNEVKPVSSGGINLDLGLGNKKNNELMFKQSNDYTMALLKEYESSKDRARTINLQRQLLNDENFDSGFGSDFVVNTRKLFERLGFGDAGVSSNEVFQATIRQQVLDRLDGSLGVGVSQGDVEFMLGMVANSSMSAEGISDYLMVQELLDKHAQRQYDFLKTYIAAQNERRQANGQPPLSQPEDIIDFQMKLMDHLNTLPELFK